MYIDTHAHIYEEEFREDREEVVQRAKEAGIGYIVLPDIDSGSRPRMLELEQLNPEMMRPLVGLHPTSVRENFREELAKVEKEAGTHRYYGIGECGIDLHWDKTYYKEQIKAFEHQLGMAKDLDFPVIIHARDALKLIFEILRKHPAVRGIFHCFSGSMPEARRAADMGFLLGIGGVVTFKKSTMAEVVEALGPAQLVLETDAPYLAPVPHRGKRNESSYLPLIAQKVSELTKTDVKKIEEITARNAMNLFNLHPENV